jgi:polar amino acid transport system permease protein
MLDFDFIRENWMFIAGGMGMTLQISVVGFMLAIPLAWIVASGRRSDVLPIKALSATYVTLIDATPLLLQIFLIFLAFPQMGIFVPGIWAAVLVLGINYSARMSEIFRIGAQSLGEDWREFMRTLIPVFAGEFISMLKDTTLIAVTGFTHDILWRATRVGRAEFKNLEALIIAIFIYWVLILSLSYLFKARKFMMTTA